MTPALPAAPPLTGQRLISLRPAGEHAPVRRAAARYGMQVVALSPWKLVQREDAATRAALASALHAEVVVFTSPAAVTAAQRLQPLRARAGQCWVAVGAGTAQRLRRAGIDGVLMPQRMDSEGLLALPALQTLHGLRVGLVTAPGGRGLIAPTLQQRGAEVLRAEVYQRVTLPPAPAALARLNPPGPLWLALTSQGALTALLESLPDSAAQRLYEARAVAASERLARFARTLGFSDPILASDARPASVLRAILACADTP